MLTSEKISLKIFLHKTPDTVPSWHQKIALSIAESLKNTSFDPIYTRFHSGRGVQYYK